MPSKSITTIIVLLGVLLVQSCAEATKSPSNTSSSETNKESYLQILGTVQDAGAPHISCKKNCCKARWGKDNTHLKVVSLGLHNAENDKNYLFEASPDISSQLDYFQKQSKSKDPLPAGIFLTHAHIGHYTGLMYLGKEACNAQSVKVFAMPKMKAFLTTNGPWSQLVTNNNIALQEINDSIPIALSANMHVRAIQVPHRDEYSETVGYHIIGAKASALFIPDIDKWERWEASIITWIEKVDYAFLDATFYDGVEINNRDISTIPHPFIVESLRKFEALPAKEKDKIHFIHFNHTNPALDPSSPAYQTIIDKGFHIAQLGQQFPL